MYSLEIEQEVFKTLKKLGKKDPPQIEAVRKKVDQILNVPFQFMPLRRRLLRYSIVKCLPTIGAMVEWVRKKAMHLFIHKVRELKLLIKSILRLIDTS